MKTKAALLRASPGKWEVAEVDLDPPKASEVLVRLEATGLCHSDDHLVSGDIPLSKSPFVGGHEGVGVVEDVGPGVGTLQVGDRIVTSFVPACGHCRWCTSGAQNLCDTGARLLAGSQSDGTYRMHLDGQDVGQMCSISTFSEYSIMPVASCVRIDTDVPASSACLLGCGVPTGWSSATLAAEVTGGDVVLVIGAGGVGMNAVQGARHVGAAHVLAVDPIAFKRDTALQFGATEVFAGVGDAADRARSLTNGQGADSAIVTVGVLAGDHIAQAFSAIRKGGIVVVTSAAPAMATGIPVSLLELTMYQKRIQGAIFGTGSPGREIPRLLELYRTGALKLDELVTQTYSIEQINDAFADMHSGRNVRGVITFES
ncbi:MAG TPA: NDMA-dependent alcohol dehydrogenase [Galbitalea sp.]|jgi:S-(hydroxymethyl)glutathione dehydrogenase/alcohol dehydrogenase